MARRRRKNKKILKWVLFLILLVVAGVICFLVWKSYFSDEENIKDNGEVVVSEIKEDTNKEETITSEEVDNKTEEPKKVMQYEGNNPNEQEVLTGVVSYAGVLDGVLKIRVNIDQYLGSGRCNLILTQNGVEVYGAAADIVASVTTSSCDGFDVPIDGLSGEFGIVIRLSSGGKTGTINGKVGL